MLKLPTSRSSKQLFAICNFWQSTCNQCSFNISFLHTSEFLHTFSLWWIAEPIKGRCSTKTWLTVVSEPLCPDAVMSGVLCVIVSCLALHKNRLLILIATQTKVYRSISVNSQYFHFCNSLLTGFCLRWDLSYMCAFFLYHCFRETELLGLSVVFSFSMTKQWVFLRKRHF